MLIIALAGAAAAGNTDFGPLDDEPPVGEPNTVRVQVKFPQLLAFCEIVMQHILEHRCSTRTACFATCIASGFVEDMCIVQL